MNDTIAPDDEWLQRPRPISADRAHAVGLITLHWNLCETELRSILIKYAGMDAQTGALFTLDMGFEGVKKRLSHFASQHERDPAVADRLRLGIEIADVCRRNRNIIAHSW